MSSTQAIPSRNSVSNRPTSGGIAIRYVWIAAALVVIANGGILLLQWSRVPIVRQPKVALNDQAFELGHWKSSAVQSPPERVLAVGADQMSERQYELDGAIVFSHRASWLSVDEWLPHEPDVCYTTQGWKIASHATIELPKRPGVQVALRSYEQSGRRLWVVFWYQIGTWAYSDRDGARPARRAFWGQRERPPLLKTVLQTLDDDASATKLLALAGLIYDANCQL